MISNSDTVANLISIEKCDQNNSEVSQEVNTESIKLDGADQRQDLENGSDDENLESKVFTVSDIQTLLNNQLTGQSSYKSQNDTIDGQSKVEQQHLILVTQNGDKIILIQNSAISSNDAHSHLIDTNDTNGEILLNDKSKVHSDENKTLNDFAFGSNRQQSFPTQFQNSHQNRQKLLLQCLGQLRLTHQARLDNNEMNIPIAECNDGNPCGDGLDPMLGDIEILKEDTRKKSVSKSSRNSRRRQLHERRISCDAKWYPYLCDNLQKAFNYLRRRSDSVEQVSKYFPSASHNFESRCMEVRRELRKLELIIERFQNVLNKELLQLNGNLKNFFEDYHLESIAAEIDEDEQSDFEEVISGTFNSQSSLISNSRRSKSFAELAASQGEFISRIEIIPPQSISITTFNDCEIDDTDPVPEVRDIDCDGPLELMDSYYANNSSHSQFQAPASLSINIRPNKSRLTKKRDADSEGMRTNCKLIKQSRI